MNAICYIVARLTLLLMVLLFSQSCHEDDGRKDSSSDSEQKITQQLLDQELLVHQERLIQLLDQGDNEIFMEHEAPILTADLSGTEMLCTEGSCVGWEKRRGWSGLVHTPVTNRNSFIFVFIQLLQMAPS